MRETLTTALALVKIHEQGEAPEDMAFVRAVEYETLRQAKCPDVVEMWLFRHRLPSLRRAVIWYEVSKRYRDLLFRDGMR